MNKTVTVNIGGIVFHIDENAYERFKQYLEAIRVHFTSSEGRDEIMQDIEARIAEMFQEKIKDHKQVITLEDVEEVTIIMGKPEQFSDEESAISSETEGQAELNIKRRLFRDPDDKMIGGVCSGVSAYFDIDPVWVRLAFVIAFFGWGSGLILYIILWIIIPKAETTADKLQMRGEPVTVSNIKRNVQEELEQVKKRLNDISTNKKPGNFLQRLLDAILQLAKFLFLFIGKIIAAFFIFIGLIMVFALFASVLAILKVPGTTYPEVLNQIFPTNFTLGLALISALIVVGVPFIMLAYFGARVLFNIRKSSRIVNSSALGLWIAGLVSCIIIGVSVAKDFSDKSTIRKQIEVQQPSNRILVLQSSNYKDNEKYYDRWDDEDEWNGDLRLSLSENQLQSRDIKLDIVKSPSDSFVLEQISHSRGSSRKTAEDHATRISYTFSQSDSVITLQPFFTIDKNQKYRGQKMRLILKVPVGGKVFLDKSVSRLIYDIDNVEDILDRDMVNRHWEMRKEGLTCIDCDGTERAIGGPHPPDLTPFPHKVKKRGVHIDKNGVYIRGDNDEEIVIDSNGVIIKE